MNIAARLMCLLVLTAFCSSARAMQFNLSPATALETFVGGRGPIIKGDVARLEQVLASVPTGRRLLALALDSPGGNVVEGQALARLIRERGLAVVIPSNSQCVSACFMLFAASTQRFAAADALVGVHSANENGTETDISLAVTTEMARFVAGMGVPPAIVGKMVQTTPGRVEWLTPADMALMHVTVYDGDPTAATRSAGASAARPAVPAPSVAIGTTPPVAPVTAPPPPVLPRPATAPPVVAGAKPVIPDIRPSEPVEVEYQGAYFCGRLTGRLTVSLFTTSETARRRAMIAFGPQPTSPEVPRGAFIVEGAIETSGGTLNVSPLKWTVQPGGYPWFGLEGRSDDGGKIFSGRVVGNPACNVFTMKRMPSGAAAR